jgi:16S rRNA processing protein RimM
MTTPPSADQLLVIGRLAGSFGIRGQLKLVALTADVAHLRRNVRTVFIGPKNQEYTLAGIFEHKPGLLIITLNGITSRAAADEMRGRDVSIRETEAAPLAEGEYFLHDLPGLLVLTEAGAEIGRVREVIETGSNEVLVVERPEGGEALIPMIRDVVRQIDWAERRITIFPMPGLLEE